VWARGQGRSGWHVGGSGLPEVEAARESGAWSGLGWSELQWSELVSRGLPGLREQRSRLRARAARGAGRVERAGWSGLSGAGARKRRVERARVERARVERARVERARLERARRGYVCRWWEKEMS
jgi:hypothetical protein